MTQKIANQTGKLTDTNMWLHPADVTQVNPPTQPTTGDGPCKSKTKSPSFAIINTKNWLFYNAVSTSCCHCINKGYLHGADATLKSRKIRPHNVYSSSVSYLQWTSANLQWKENK